MRKKRSKSRSKSLRKINFYLCILESIQRTNSLPPFKSKQKRNWYVKRLKSLNLIRKVGYGTWELTDKGKSFLEEVKVKSQGVKNFYFFEMDVVARISIPILKELENPFPSDIEREVKGWIKKYRWVSIPFYDIDLTIEKTPKNLICYIHHIKLQDPSDLEVLVNTVKRWLKEYFSSKRILILDDLRAKTVWLKYGIHDPLTKKAIPKGVSVEVNLGRKRKKILPFDTPEEARVWFDKTPFDYTIHSNDETYVQKYLLMPEMLDKLLRQFTPAIQDLTNQIKTHLRVMNKIEENLDIQRRIMELNYSSPNNEILKKLDRIEKTLQKIAEKTELEKRILKKQRMRDVLNELD